MDDFNVNGLQESKNEWSARLVNILTPFVIEGIKSMFTESHKLCINNGEEEKYLMTFQNFLSRTPKWNANIIEDERKRIIQRSNCTYLEDLITCVHIIQLKLLTAVRVGNKQKKINISIPKLDDFIHKIYINTCRKLYSHVYLFELKIPPLQVQKHNRELEIIVQDNILNTIRESIPVETILRAYLDESIEEEIEEEIVEKEIKQIQPRTVNKSRKRRIHEGGSEPAPEPEIKLSGIDDPIDNEIKALKEFVKEPTPVYTPPPEIARPPSPVPALQTLSFNDIGKARDENNKDTEINVSKDVTKDGLKDFNFSDDSDKIKIFDDVPISLNIESLSDSLLGDITVL
jgi:hypothetical protein